MKLKNQIKKLFKEKIDKIKTIVLFFWYKSTPSLKDKDLPYLRYLGEYEDELNLREKGSYSEHLYSAVRHLEPDIIVELGVKAGVTMKYMLDAIKKNETNSKIIGIDLPIDNPDVEDPYATILNKQFYKNHSEIWQRNTQKIETVNFFKLKFSHIDLLFIDADHSYKGVLTDYKLWSPLVRKGGYIFFDDLQIKGPRKVWLQMNGEKYLFKTTRRKRIQLCGLVIIK